MEHKGRDPDLIELVNKLQNKLTTSGSTLEIALPQIVVVGSQSSGKSSVLENIVGRQFLPRGSGVVTRRPTIVQLTPSKTEYARFEHLPDQIFYDFGEVSEEIRAETRRDPGPHDFSSNPISLQIFSPNVLKLTLVDLPGMIKNIIGDQSERAVEQVRQMVLQYITPKESLILAISPANQDIANSDALDIAKTVDPNRLRTFGVLTKLDIMDEGTDAREELENKIIPLAKGYVGVVNRSQREIDEDKDIDYILEKEERFFESHPSYKHMVHRMGTKYLQQLLHKHLKAHIQAYLPTVRTEITRKLKLFRKELKDLRERLGDGELGKQHYMLNLTQMFINDMELKLLGQSEMVDSKVVMAGAVINRKMYTSIQKRLKLKLEPNRDELTVIIVNICGIRTPYSIPSLTAEAACKYLLEQYKEPLEESVEYIAEVLISAIAESSKVADRYLTLRNELEYRTNNCVDNAVEKTVESLKNHIDAEMFFINYLHQDFVSSNIEAEAPTAGPVKLWDENEYTEDDETATIVPKLQSSPAVEKTVNYITSILSKYLEIIQKQIRDTVIKYIAYFLVKRTLNFLKKELIPYLASCNVNNLMQDGESEYRRMGELEMTCSSLKEVLEAIKTF